MSVTDDPKTLGRTRLSFASEADIDEFVSVLDQFERVYLSPEQRIHTEPAVALIRRLVDYHLAHPDELPTTYRDTDADLTTQVVDYVAGMTDRYAVMVNERLFGSLQ